MANINISDLRPAGADLFLDSESYLNDLTEGEMTNTLGGSFMICTSTSKPTLSLLYCNQWVTGLSTTGLIDWEWALSGDLP